MSQLVIKTTLKGDLRRFSVKLDIPWVEFQQLLSKLYDINMSAYRITYKDEEGDDLLVTTDEELQEGLRIACLMKPPIFRVSLSLSLSNSIIASVPMDESDRLEVAKDCKIYSESSPAAPSVPVVYVSGRAYVPLTVDKPKNYGVTKVGSEDFQWSWPRQSKCEDGSSARPIPDGSTSDPSVSTAVSSVSAPTPSVSTASIPVVNNTAPLKPASLNSIAETMCNLVLDSANSVGRNSASVSDAIVLHTLSTANATGDSSLSTSSLVSLSTQRISSGAIASELTDTIRNLADISAHASRLSSDACAWATATVKLNAAETEKSISPVSQSTRNIQTAATFGMEEERNKLSEDVVRSIFNAVARKD